MSKSKIDFIADLLSNKRLDSSLKEKFFGLAANELKNFHASDTQMWDELNKLKTKFEKEIKGRKVVIYSTHDPKKTAQSLKLFKSGNRLKWLTHVYPNSEDNSFDYAKITKAAITEFQEISKSLPPKVAAFISVFIKKPLKVKTDKIFYLGDYYDTWWSSKVIDWCKEHPGLHPDTDEELSKFIITPFKKGVEIRDGNDLINAIKYKLERTFGPEIFTELDIDFSGVRKGTRFFTGVDQLMTGMAALFAPIRKRKNVSNRVSVSSKVEEINGQFVSVVEISHLNSHCDKEFTSDVLLNGDMLTAKNEFLSLCDWYVSASFLNGSFGVYLLDSYGDIEEPTLDEDINNFTHKLIFY